MQDEFAFASQMHAKAADRVRGFVRDEIVPVHIPQKKGDPSSWIQTSTHAGYDDGTTWQAWRRGSQGGTVTAGNASGINDGAAAVLLMSADKAGRTWPQANGALDRIGGGRRESAYDGLWADPGTRKVLERGLD